MPDIRDSAHGDSRSRDRLDAVGPDGKIHPSILNSTRTTSGSDLAYDPPSVHDVPGMSPFEVANVRFRRDAAASPPVPENPSKIDFIQNSQLKIDRIGKGNPYEPHELKAYRPEMSSMYVYPEMDKTKVSSTNRVARETSNKEQRTVDLEAFRSCLLKTVEDPKLTVAEKREKIRGLVGYINTHRELNYLSRQMRKDLRACAEEHPTLVDKAWFSPLNPLDKPLE
jgi:hypothetical protein